MKSMKKLNGSSLDTSQIESEPEVAKEFKKSIKKQKLMPINIPLTSIIQL
jgi:hypothetical protein